MILEANQVIDFLKKERQQGHKIVFTNGCFDILHMGHVDYLNKAKALGDILILGLNSDKSVKVLKGIGRPFISEDQRAFILDNLKSIDAVVLFDDDTPARLIETIKPDILAKGADYSIDQIAGAKFVVNNGGEVILIPFLNGYSTSQIISKIRANYK